MKEIHETQAAEAAITEQLALVATALEDCFGKARVITEDNEYGHRRRAEFQSAVTLLKASAKLGLALARIKGEFNQNIRVHREGESQKRGSIGQKRRRAPEPPENPGNG